MTCWSLEFSVAQWLEHPTSIWKIDVVDSNPILNSYIWAFKRFQNGRKPTLWLHAILASLFGWGSRHRDDLMLGNKSRLDEIVQPGKLRRCPVHIISTSVFDLVIKHLIYYFKFLNRYQAILFLDIVVTIKTNTPKKKKKKKHENINCTSKQRWLHANLPLPSSLMERW